MSWLDLEDKKTTDKIPYTKFEKGNTMIRILDDEPFSFWSHWLQNQQTSVTCIGKGCPICGIIAQMKANKEKPMYSSSKRHAMRIWNYNTNQMEIMIQGKTFFSQLLDYHKEVGPVNSYDIKVIRKGDGTETTYTLLPQAVKAFEITDGVTDVDMGVQFKAPTHEEMMLLIEGKTWAEINGTEEMAA